MYKTCSRCGKIHPANYKCNKGKVYRGGEERKLRNTYAWEKKSKEVREKANYLCEVCRAEGRYIYNNIEVHHITKITEDKSLLLDDFNLVCLCQEHHKKADKGLIDADYLRELAWLRENNIFPEEEIEE